MIDNQDELDDFFMGEALKKAEEAEREGEVPIGAVAVKDGEIIARGHNQRRGLSDITAHAEIMALRELSPGLDSMDLSGITIYSTLEPCAMCAGAMLHYRVARIVYGARDLKLGAIDSRFHVLKGSEVEVRGGVLRDKCTAILLKFFEKELGRPSREWEDIAI
jgi:tRNA(adenine34) deaminase